MLEAFIIVLCTCPSEAESERVAKVLIDERLAACVNILPPVKSIYRWQGVVESAAESLLIIKTVAECFPHLRDRILQLHSYDTPEVIAIPIADGSEKYLAWLRDQVLPEASGRIS